MRVPPRRGSGTLLAPHGHRQTQACACIQWVKDTEKRSCISPLLLASLIYFRVTPHPVELSSRSQCFCQARCPTSVLGTQPRLSRSLQPPDPPALCPPHTHLYLLLSETFSNNSVLQPGMSFLALCLAAFFMGERPGVLAFFFSIMDLSVFSQVYQS